jgi:hypothetical protein
MNRAHHPIPEAIVQLQQQLEQWRATQPGRTKLPEAFWQSAAELARRHGLNPTAKALRLDYAALKRRLSESPRPKRKPAQTAFVELVAPRAAKLEECIIEFESRQGSKMRIQWKASAPPDWPALLRAWRNAEKG